MAALPHRQRSTEGAAHDALQHSAGPALLFRSKSHSAAPPGGTALACTALRGCASLEVLHSGHGSSRLLEITQLAASHAHAES